MENTNYTFDQEPRTYYLRGMGVLCLVALLFAAGVWRFGEESMQVGSFGGNRSQPIYSVDTTDKKLALTFDTEGNEGDIGKILEVLKAHDVRATFFVKGSWVEAYPLWIKRISAAGHDLGNQGSQHKDMRKLDKEKAEQELMGVHESVKELTGAEMELFRPPLGAYDEAVVQVASGNGYTTVCWSIDSLDWKDYGSNSIVNTVVNQAVLAKGDIVLFHSNAKYTAAALEQVIVELQKRGYQIVPISELLLDLS